MTFNQNLKISKDVLSQEVNGETVLLDLNSESYFGLDEVGTRIWQLMREGERPEKIVDILREEYDVDENKLRKDLDELLAKLIDEGIVLVQSEESGEQNL